jgi:ubiquinone/menaquinone biosynthesis C-methylase UbiE
MNAFPVPVVDPRDGKPLCPTENGLMAEDGECYPYVRGAYRMLLPHERQGNYTENFGKQWNIFARTQIDDHSGVELSRRRFFAQTGWDEMPGETLLEVGSGAGRFSRVVLQHTRATLYSVDYSAAVEANYANNGPHERLFLFQAGVYALPFPPESFDKVFCFGVLQHTPDVRKTVRSLAEMVKPGGQLAVDFYPIKGWWSKIHAKYILRPWTKNMDHEKLLALIRRYTPRMLAIADFSYKIGLGKIVNRFLPLCDVKVCLPPGLSPEQRLEWAVLDTFDMFSPAYDQPQKISTVEKWFKELGFKDVFAGFVHYEGGSGAVVRGTKPGKTP